MEELWILILVLIFSTNLLEKAKSVQLEELPLQTFDELFVEEWWDKDEAEDLKTPAPIKFGQNVHHQIDRQNTQIGQIEPNSTDQNSLLTKSDQSGQIEPNLTDQNSPLTESDHSGQIEPNLTDQNSPLTESDHSDNDKNGEEQNKLIKEMSSNKNIAEDERKHKIIDKFQAMKDEFKQIGKYSTKEWVQIEKKIAKNLKVYRTKIYKWKKEFGLTRKVLYEKEEQKHLVEKFEQMKAELKRDGIKNSRNELDKTVAKELGLNFGTLYKWKSELGQTTPKHKYLHSEQQELMKRYYEIKDQKLKTSDKEIAKMLKIGRRTLFRWKSQFKRQ